MCQNVKFLDWHYLLFRLRTAWHTKLLPCRWRQCIPTKRQYPPTRLHVARNESLHYRQDLKYPHFITNICGTGAKLWPFDRFTVRQTCNKSVLCQNVSLCKQCQVVYLQASTRTSFHVKSVLSYVTVTCARRLMHLSVKCKSLRVQYPIMAGENCNERISFQFLQLSFCTVTWQEIRVI